MRKEASISDRMSDCIICAKFGEVTKYLIHVRGFCVIVPNSKFLFKSGVYEFTKQRLVPEKLYSLDILRLRWVLSGHRTF